MDDAWREIYNENATRDIPIHEMSCWTEQGFHELFKTTFEILKNLKNIKTVLDVGCGPGAYCKELQKKGYEATGIDYAENVIKKAQKNHPELKFFQGNAYDLPVKDQTFDLTICIGVLQCVLEPEKIIKELTRVTKKYIIISTLLRQRKVEEPMNLLKHKLRTDTWPTRDYHPSELETLLEKEGYTTKIILKNKGELIQDGFFIIATKNT